MCPKGVHLAAILALGLVPVPVLVLVLVVLPVPAQACTSSPAGPERSH